MRSSFLSPWSLRVDSSPEFARSADMNTTNSQASASTFLEAPSFLDRFCTRHNIVDQSHPALTAVILFPYMAGRNLDTPFRSLGEQQQEQTLKSPFDHHTGSNSSTSQMTRNSSTASHAEL
ncbi:hypothetical protein J1614_002875 [Plenodomus biglobosus]|nr:hypothetical protein J1614_002875 [Plenodomus biglobosus]